MKVNAKLRTETTGLNTRVYIDIEIDGSSEHVTPKVLISAPTHLIGHLDPETATMGDYVNAVRLLART